LLCERIQNPRRKRVHTTNNIHHDDAKCLLGIVLFLYKVILGRLPYQAILIDVRQLITIKV